MQKNKMKKLRKNEKGKKKEKKKNKRKKKKRGSKGVPLPRRSHKLIFYIRTVMRNRNEIETQKESDFEHPTKKKNNKEKRK